MLQLHGRRALICRDYHHIAPLSSQYRATKKPFIAKTVLGHDCLLPLKRVLHLPQIYISYLLYILRPSDTKCILTNWVNVRHIDVKDAVLWCGMESELWTFESKKSSCTLLIHFRQAEYKKCITKNNHHRQFNSTVEVDGSIDHEVM